MLEEWWDEESPQTPDEVRRRHAANRASWDQAALHYTADNDGRIADLRAGKSNLHPIERAMLGDLRPWCTTAIHLQCASGRDTLSLWLEGAQRVVGVDISPVHIDNARLTSAALDAPAEWYCCDLFDTPHELDGTADLVYTGRGAISWIQDLEPWAAVVARLLQPGGVLSLFDDHPTAFLFDPDADHLRYNGTGYFDAAFAGRGWSASYIDELPIADEDLLVHYDRLWNFADLFAAITGAGLTIEHLGEHPEPYWGGFPNIVPEEAARIPQTFSIRARKPAG